MSQDKFSWKSLFVNEDGESSPKKEEQLPSSMQTEDTRFPVNPQMNSMPVAGNTPNNPYIDEIVQVYEKGVDSLNLEGFDFFELYKSVLAVGVANPQSYQMAFTMGKTIKNDLTKEFLLEKSKYYIDEIEKVYVRYDSIGTKRKHDLDMNITRDKVNLAKSISDLEAKIAELQKELQDKKLELSKIDSGNQEQYTEIQLKMEANNYAKAKIIGSINSVISGINQFL